MNLESLQTITMPPEEAKAKWREYLDAEVKTKDAIYGELKQLYHQLARGRKIIDVPSSLEHAGLNADGDPRLAVAPAGSQFCFLNKRRDSWAPGARTWGRFSGDRRVSENVYRRMSSERFVEADFQFPKAENGSILRADVRAPLPLVPPSVISKLHNDELNNPNYWILWEVEKWEMVAPRDPILLRRLSKNLFVIIDKWNLSKLEQKVAQGRL